MSFQQLSFHQTQAVSRLMLDYLDEAAQLKPYVRAFPSLSALKEQAELKAKEYQHRAVLQNFLASYYAKNMKGDQAIFESSLNSINLLKEEQTFTVCTGHQLNLAGGPLYFIYKIAGAIALANELNEKFPSKHVIPVYWMASEDHDWEEVNHFHFHGEKHQLNQEIKSAVAYADTKEAAQLLSSLAKNKAHLESCQPLFEIYLRAYQNGENFAQATFLLVSELFKGHGLVILDANAKELKELFRPVMEEELFGKNVAAIVDQQSEMLKEAYFAQVNPREINLFYLDKDQRARIVKSPDGYEVQGTQMVFSDKQLKELLERKPEKFSPNVILRPLYQECILPNLAYIGGGGEIAYWLQLKAAFDQHKILFPILFLRNSMAFLSSKAIGKMEKYGIKLEDAFKKESVFARSVLLEESEYPALLNELKQDLESIANRLKEKLRSLDKSLIPSVDAELARQAKGAKRVEKKIIRALKRKQKEKMAAFEYIQKELYPEGSLQERKENLLSLVNYADLEVINEIIPAMNPLTKRFIIFEAKLKKAHS